MASSTTARVTSHEGSELPDDARATGTRRRILEAGLELFAERGYYAASIRDIAELAGMRSASLYTHFSSKEAILAELVLLGNEVHHRLLVTALLEAGSDPTDQLVALVRAHVHSHGRFSRLALVAAAEGGRLSPAAAAPAITLRDRSRDLLDEVLRRGMAQGCFDIDDLRVTRVAIASLGGAVASWFPTVRDDVTVEAVADAYVPLVLRLVGAPAR